MTEENSKVWFITGATRGIGAEIAKAALAAGDQVVATGRNPKAVEEALGPSDSLFAEIAAFAVRESKDDSIRAVGWRILHEMRANGDPFAEEFIREIGLASPEVIHRLEEERRKQSQNEELLRRQKRTPEQDQELGQSL